MLEINIVGFSGEDLNLEVDGQPNNGNSTAKRREEVHWVIKNGSGVKSIKEISMKNIKGTSDIFSASPPRADASDPKLWRAKVNNNADNFAVYIYKIVWVQDDGTEHTYDPILSIRPSIYISTFEQILYTGTALTIGAFASFIYWRKLRMEMKKKIEQLKMKK